MSARGLHLLRVLLQAAILEQLHIPAQHRIWVLYLSGWLDATDAAVAGAGAGAAASKHVEVGRCRGVGEKLHLGRRDWNRMCMSGATMTEGDDGCAGDAGCNKVLGDNRRGKGPAERPPRVLTHAAQEQPSCILHFLCPRIVGTIYIRYK